MDEPAEENYMSLDESYSGNVSVIKVDKNNKYGRPHGNFIIFCIMQRHGDDDDDMDIDDSFAQSALRVCHK